MAELMSSDCCASSCADPPMGRITKYSATRLAAARMPSPKRMSARGLLGGQILATLKPLGISHRDVIAIEGIGLRWRGGRLHAAVPKLRRGFQALQQIQDGRHIFGSHYHVQQYLVVGIHLRKPHRDQPDVIG